jgi:hypothetical protein
MTFPRPRRVGFAIVPLALLVVIGVGAGPGPSKARSKTPPKPAAPDKCCAVPPASAKPAASGKAANDYPGENATRHYVTVRGEIVDYFCYIEKGLTGPAHKDCGTRCVAGDVCMGILTTDKQLYMISVNHLRAMDPTAFRGMPDPFTTCRGWMAETVDLGGYAMERRGQKIIEIMNVKKASGPPPAGDPPARSQ